MCMCVYIDVYTYTYRHSLALSTKMAWEQLHAHLALTSCLLKPFFSKRNQGSSLEKWLIFRAKVGKV